MRFTAVRDLADVVVFSAIGVAVLAAAAGSLASVPQLPLETEVVEASVMPVPLLVDISAFVPPVEAEPEPEPPSVDEILAAPSLPRARTRTPAALPKAREAAEPVAVVKKPTPAAKSRPKGCTEPPDALIQSTGPDAWTVRHGVVQRYTRDWSKLDDLGWSKPHDGADGRGDGMQIGGVRCGSDLYDAGIRSGDVIHSVNGRAVKNIPQALLVYAAIHNDDVFRVAITRRGEPKTLTYRLR